VRRALHYWAPVLAWMGVIFAASSRPQVPYQGHVPDWLPHVAVYLVLALLAGRAFGSGGALDLRLTALTFALCVGYGVSDEWHQSFVPGRHPDVWDVFKDAVGALLGVAAYRAWSYRVAADEAGLP